MRAKVDETGRRPSSKTKARSALVIALALLATGCTKDLTPEIVNDVLSTQLRAYKGVGCSVGAVEVRDEGAYMYQWSSNDWAACISELSSAGVVEVVGEPFYDDPYVVQKIGAIPPTKVVEGSTADSKSLLVVDGCKVSRVMSIDKIERQGDGKTARVRYSYAQEILPQLQKLSQHCGELAKLELGTGTLWREFALEEGAWTLSGDPSVVEVTKRNAGKYIEYGSEKGEANRGLAESGLEKRSLLRVASESRRERRALMGLGR